MGGGGFGVGEPLLSAVLQVLFQKIASPEVAQYFESRRLSRRHFMKLDTAITSCNSVVDDAVEKQLFQPSVKKWLLELKDAVFEAEDLLDEIAFAILRSELEARSSRRKVRDFISTYNPFNKGIQERLKEVLKTLHYLVKQKDHLGLKENKIGQQSSQKISTTSVVDESSFYGRDGDKEAIVQLLLSDDRNGESLGVIPIVGMGGIGKTALAQIVYNDSRVQDWFAIKAWVYVSEEFDVFNITKDILKEVSFEVTCDAKTHNQIQLELKQKLKGKRFLIVLDDVWNENYDDWDLLRRPLMSGAPGSKILVTTRNDTAASIIRTVPSHRLKELNDGDCWLLFAKHAFDNGRSDVYPDLETIGKEIVRKCNGLPLATKTLGGLLHSNRKCKEWEKILENDMWDFTCENILPSLKVSYNHLPVHLKRCFVYCAIFPKNYEFAKEELILLWMAEDFLVYSKGNKEMEEVGDDYFNEFVSRSFFQPSRIHQSCFIMHDLINDLAKFIAGEICNTLDDDDGSHRISKRIRHLSYARSEYDPCHKFDCIKKAKFLRTFLPLNSVWRSTYGIDSEIAYKLIPKLGRLRVLSLSQYGDISELPDSVIRLKHLRYLNLQGTSIERLPRHVYKLYNLQTLILRGCEGLVELPTNLARLINLCYLDIRETQLKEMPPQMGKLKKLQKLTDFFQGKQSSSSIRELGNLQNLYGEICLWNLENVVDVHDASRANLKGKKYLKELTLRWGSNTHDPEQETGVLERLQPHGNIQRFSIVGYGGTGFPHWVGDSSFLNISSLSLIECKYCSILPPLGQLPSLKDLYISGFDGITDIGLEFYGSCTSLNKPFPSLRILKFEKMLQWKDWSDPEYEAFPLLQELWIKECPNISTAIRSHLPSLATVEIEECQQFVASFPKAPSINVIKVKRSTHNMQVRKLPSGLYHLKVYGFHTSGSLQEKLEQMGYLLSTLEEIELKNCDTFESLSLDLFPCLKSLRISRCPYLKSIDLSSQDFTSLRVLEIKKCADLEFLPRSFWATNLNRLLLQGCPKLKWLPEYMEILLPSLVDLQIGNCPQVGVRRLKLPLPSRLKSFSIWDCSELIFHLMQGHLLLPNSVSFFHAGIYEATESFPEEKLQLPSELISLRIRGFQNLKSLNHRQLQHLTCLEELTIIHCPLLQFAPGEQLPCTLASLRICDLQNLTTLENMGLPNLSRLKELTIIDCPNIQSMPEGLPSSLSTLSIWKCPLLEQRCLKEKGEDWTKISHIPRINIYVHKIN